MYALLNERRLKEFRFDLLLACVAFCFWMRFLFMLFLTKSFGPMLSMVIKMVLEIGDFFALMGITLVAFISVAILVFGELQDYRNFTDAIVYFFRASYGDTGFGIYDELGEDERYGGYAF
jgi:hypothetical protein